MIKILAENKTRSIPTAQSNTEKFKLVKRETNQKSYKVKNERKFGDKLLKLLRNSVHN